MQYRVEQKYICDAKQLAVLQSRLRHLLKADKNAGTENEYKVKSVYFDDHFHSGFWENEDGIGMRNKYRIRTYNDSDEVIRLEIKKKTYSYTNKASCSLTKEQAIAAILGHGLPLLEDMPPAYAQMVAKTKCDLLKPVVTVEYLREAYVFPQGNVRITLDKEITASSHTQCFFDKARGRRLLLPTGHFVLEVKYDEFLPTHIYNALNLHYLQQSAFSKYYLSRLALKETFFRTPSPANFQNASFC
ncbi:MAG: polyphosphate polymerase domain-containing protein [Faecalibacterium sp.]